MVVIGSLGDEGFLAVGLLSVPKLMFWDDRCPPSPYGSHSPLSHDPLRMVSFHAVKPQPSSHVGPGCTFLLASLAFQFSSLKRQDAEEGQQRARAQDRTQGADEYLLCTALCEFG